MTTELAEVPGDKTPTRPDAELFRLIRELKKVSEIRKIAESVDAEAGSLDRRCNALFLRILLETPAKTLQGTVAKLCVKEKWDVFLAEAVRLEGMA